MRWVVRVEVAGKGVVGAGEGVGGKIRLRVM